MTRVQGYKSEPPQPPGNNYPTDYMAAIFDNSGVHNSQAAIANSANAPLAQTTTAVATPRAGKSDFVRPEHKTLVPGRIVDAGPTPHPDPNFRPYGPNQWTDILHDHTLLRFISKNEIGDIKKHCEKLSKIDQGPKNSPVLIDNGPYDTSDARAVWQYCAVYIKRRDQLRNNVSAKKSRSRKDSEVKHWKAIALAAGAPDKPFRYQEDDPAYDPACEKEGVIAEETQEAILAMIQTWDWKLHGGGGSGSTGNPTGQLPLPAIHEDMSTVADIVGAQSLASGSTSPEFALMESLQGQLPLPVFEGAASAALDNSPQLNSPAQVFSPVMQQPSDRPQVQAQRHGHLHAKKPRDQSMASSLVDPLAPLLSAPPSIEASSVPIDPSVTTAPSSAKLGEDSVDYRSMFIPHTFHLPAGLNWNRYQGGPR